MTEFLAFLRRAKLATYAAQGDDASVEPRLPDSKQLEFADGSYLYRDIYVGLLRFVGQEIVYRDARAFWSMAYAGRLNSEVTGSEAVSIYRALREALSATPVDFPVRGPRELEAHGLRYSCTSVGSIATFHGEERISRGSEVLFELRFAGGTLA
jgi:hypothetical protein